MTADGSPVDDLTRLMGSRLAQYRDLWESANAKLSDGTYHAEDLVDDWFRWLGMAARDATAAATVLFGGVPGGGSSPSSSTSPSSPSSASPGDEPGG